MFIGERYVDPDYEARRRDAFFVAVNCGEAGGTCFCASMGTGPAGRSATTSRSPSCSTRTATGFVVEVGSERGRRGPRRAAARAGARRTSAPPPGASSSAPRGMGRDARPTDIRELLQRNPEHPRWDDVADRCLSCGNCTMVCPTCFCSTVEDVTDLAGEEAERTRVWDSCFTLDHSYIHGGSVRRSTRSRYRQWMTHKLATWIDQFGTSGCVGCGRCITWCPVAIDITEEVAAIRDRGGPMQTIDELLGEVAALRGLRRARSTIAGCARNRVFGAGEQLLREGEPADAFYVIRQGAVALETYVPQRGAVTSRRCTAATCSAGRGSSRPTARRSTRGRSAPCTRSRFDGACLRGKCERRPRARLRADEERFAEVLARAPAGRRGCGCSTSMAPCPRSLSPREGGPMVPASFRVARPARRPTTRGRSRSRPPAAPCSRRFAPGQFAMLYAFGGRGADLGQRDPEAAHASTRIRAVGAVTRRALRRAPGDVVGVRGPFGTAWPVEAAEGADVVVVAGGIGLAPLRPVVHALLANRERYGRVVVLYGGRSPPRSCSTRRARALARALRRRGGRDRRRGGRPAGRARRRRHDAVPARRVRPAHTVAMICGPEVMMRFAVAALHGAACRRTRSSCRSSAA